MGMIFRQYSEGIIELPKNYKLLKKYKGGRHPQYLSCFGTFDTEATNILIPSDDEEELDTKCGILYLWTFSFGGGGYYGRNTQTLKKFFEELSMKISPNKLVVYTHNLSYDFMFMSDVLEFADVLARDPHNIIKVVYKNIEFRCSEKLTNKSLEKFLEAMDTPVQKLKYDYDKERLPHTPLTDDEMQYCFNDVIGLHQAIEAKMRRDGDNILTIPLTSTGYIRRIIKRKESRKDKFMIREINQMSEDLYYYLKQSYIGGNSYANRFVLDQKLENVYCYDITSSYPFTQLADVFPVTQFEPLTQEQIDGINNKTIDVFRRDYAYILELQFDGLYENMGSYCPVLPLYTCMDINGLIGRVGNRLTLGYESFSGRVLWAGHFRCVLTDVDYEVLLTHYSAEKITVMSGYRALYGYLPKSIKSSIIDLFNQKCDLKKAGKTYDYNKSKEILNAIYGMSAQDPGKQHYTIKNNCIVEEDIPLSDLLHEATSQLGKSAEPYSWGVWVASWGHYHLNELILTASDSFVYCDTDSVYTTKPVDLELLNGINQGRLIQAFMPLRDDEQYAGKWKLEKKCVEFKCLRPKVYAYKKDDEIKFTVAGVEDANSKFGQDLDEFTDGFTIPNASKSLTYFYASEEYPVKYKNYTIGNSVYIEKTDYTLSKAGGFSI